MYPSPPAGENPRVSVVLPTFNRAKTLFRACESVLAQHPPVFELIVVDDGSTDGTADLMAALSARDPRVRYIRQPNSGGGAARNRGIDAARGEVIAFQDSDDEWLAGKLAAQLESRGGSPALVFTAHTVVMIDGSEEVRPKIASDRASDLLAHNFISTQTVLVDRVILGASRFDERLRRLQDWDLWLSLISASANIRIVYVPQPLVRLYRQEDSLTNSEPAYYESLRLILSKHWRLYRKQPVRWLRHVARLVRYSARTST